MKQKEDLKQNNTLISDEELDKVAGGNNTRSLYGTPSCPGPERGNHLKCRRCADAGSGPMHETEYGSSTFICNHK